MVDSLSSNRRRQHQWVLYHLQRKGFDERQCFRSKVATCLDSTTRAIAIVLVAAIGIAVGDADVGAEGIIY